MKRNLYTGILLITIVFFLAGCITIPLGEDKVIEISKSGVRIVENIVEDEADDDEQNHGSQSMPAGAAAIPNNNEPQKKNVNEDIDERPNIIPEEEEDEEEEEEKLLGYKHQEENSITYEGEPEEDTECNYDYSEFTDHIPVDVYIPYCGVLVGVVDFSNSVSAGFLVDLVSYDHILNNYRAYLGLGRDENFDSDKLERYELGRGILISGNIRGGGRLHVNLEQRQGYVYVALNYFK